MLKILSFGNYTKNKNLTNNNNVAKNNFKLYASKLTPLQYDCVSFTSRGKKQAEDQLMLPEIIMRESKSENKKLVEKERTITSALANKLHQEALEDTSQLQRAIDRALSPLRVKEGKLCDIKHPVHSIEYRTKSANSIREKASQKFLYKKESVIKNIHDLVGARIILGTSEQRGINDVIDKLVECVKDGKLKITEVENHIPADKKYQYASQTKLHQLAQASSDRYGISVPEINTTRDSGYIAIHLSIEFPDGITGEIQILGENVANLKEIEDIPYKILQGKSIDPKYKSIKEIFESILQIGNDPTSPENIERTKLRKEFAAYTTAAYKHERDKKPQHSAEEYPIPSFLTLYEFSKIYGKKVHLDPKMDFNYLCRLKLMADNNPQNHK